MGKSKHTKSFYFHFLLLQYDGSFTYQYVQLCSYHNWIIDIHTHIVCDGLSMNILYISFPPDSIGQKASQQTCISWYSWCDGLHSDGPLYLYYEKNWDLSPNGLDSSKFTRLMKRYDRMLYYFSALLLP